MTEAPCNQDALCENPEKILHVIPLTENLSNVTKACCNQDALCENPESRTIVHCIGNVHNIGEIMLTVDLQNCLITPVMTNSQSFYSLKLWTYNYPLYDSTNKVTTCVMWDESKASRVANEMALGMLHWAQNNIQPHHREIIVWSENCPSQNRNFIMVMAYETDDFFGTPGRRAPSSNASPIDYFNLFFTTLLLKSIFIESHVLSDNSRIKKWTQTNVPEIKAFIAVLLEMGITKRPTIYC
nr:unnamed protein product [Callosobruchus chinensis]